MHTITCTTITFRFGISRFTPRQNPKKEVIRTEISGRTIQITKRDISLDEDLCTNSFDAEYADQQMKYAKVMAVAGGVTAVQGSPSSNTDAWDSMLSKHRIVQLRWRRDSY